MEKKNDVDTHKAYKEKPYLNLNKQPFGLTLKGKTKEYIDAHITIKGLLIKGKEIATSVGRMKILDTTNNRAMVNTIVEIESKEGIKGKAELKAYDPNKQKGATIEIRKMSDYEYVHVEHLKNVITGLIDSIIAGENVEHSKVGTKNKVVSRVVSNPKLFTCNVCDWQTKFASALKAHKKKMHSKFPVDNNQLSKEPTKKRSNVGLQCNHCDLSFQCSTL
jgi:hypothetical protein